MEQYAILAQYALVALLAIILLDALANLLFAQNPKLPQHPPPYANLSKEGVLSSPDADERSPSAPNGATAYELVDGALTASADRPAAGRRPLLVRTRTRGWARRILAWIRSCGPGSGRTCAARLSARRSTRSRRRA